jgi:hypothetical protein
MRMISRSIFVLIVISLVSASTMSGSIADNAALPQSPEQSAIDAQQSRLPRPDQVTGNRPLSDMEREQAKAINKKRHDDLKRDTDHLLELATDLKLTVDKSTEQTLSLDVVKKAEAVEKLAKSVQKKMRGY